MTVRVCHSRFAGTTQVSPRFAIDRGCMNNISMHDSRRTTTTAEGRPARDVTASPFRIMRAAVDTVEGVDRRARTVGDHSMPHPQVEEPLRPMTGMAPSGVRTRVLRFAGIGLLSATGYLLLYLGFRTGMSAQAANATALSISVITNAWANTRFTLGIRPGAPTARQGALGLLVLGVGLVLTSGSLFAAQLSDPALTRLGEVVTLIVANLAVSVLGTVLLLDWVLKRSPWAAESAMVR
jgi:putative flippase GtrA